jgi:hypothetical protein
MGETAYVAFVCKKCGRAQGTYYAKKLLRTKKMCSCKNCRYTTKLYSVKNPVKILKESDDLTEINNICKIYNANQENIKYDWQKGESLMKWEVEPEIKWE